MPAWSQHRRCFRTRGTSCTRHDWRVYTFLSELSVWKGEWVEFSSPLPSGPCSLVCSDYSSVLKRVWVNSWWPSADTEINYSVCLIWEFKASWWNLQNCIMPLTFWDFITISSIIHWACLFSSRHSDRAAGQWQAAGGAFFSLFSCFSWYLVGETCLVLYCIKPLTQSSNLYSSQTRKSLQPSLLLEVSQWTVIIVSFLLP